GRARGRAVQDLDGRPALLEELGLVPAVGQARGGGEHRHRARLAEAEIEVLLREAAVELEALDAQPAEERHRPPHAARRARGAEPPEPPGELEARARPD